MAWEYSEKTKQLFLDAVNHSKNAHIGEIKDPDGESLHGSLVCGDAIRLTFRVKKDEKNPENDIITEMRYLTFGCTSAIAASEAICIIIEEGKFTPIKALSLKKDDVVKFLGGLPVQKIHCSIMSIEALYGAVYDWAKKRGLDLKKVGIQTECLTHEEDNDQRIVCRCMGLSKGYIRDQIRDLGIKTVDEVISVIKAGSVCGSCIDEPGGIKDILKEVNILGSTRSQQTSTSGVEDKTPYQVAKDIEAVLISDVIPILERDGGGLEIVDIRGYELYFRLKGACKHCHASNDTIEYTVEKILRDKVSPKVKVINVG